MRSLILALAVGAASLGSSAVTHHAEARPAGWKCSFSETAYTIRRRKDRTVFYACYGRTLRGTKALARQACRSLSSCQRGACIPLNYRPRTYCEGGY